MEDGENGAKGLCNCYTRKTRWFFSIKFDEQKSKSAWIGSRKKGEAAIIVFSEIERQIDWWQAQEPEPTTPRIKKWWLSKNMFETNFTRLWLYALLCHLSTSRHDLSFTLFCCMRLFGAPLSPTASLHDLRVVRRSCDRSLRGRYYVQKSKKRYYNEKC